VTDSCRAALRRFAGLVVVATVVATTACSSNKGAATTDTAGKVRVVAGLAPLAEVVARVGGDRVEVTNLTATGAEPHDLELSPRQIDAIAGAARVFYLGRTLQPAVAGAARRAGDRAVDLLPAADPDGDDAHVWLDPLRLAKIVDRVTTELAAVDDSDAAAFRRRGTEIRAELTALDAEYRVGLATCARRRIVTAHRAFGYLAVRYGLEQAPITGLSPEAEPDPRRLAELVDLVRSDGTTTIFTEALVSPKIAATLAREAGVTTAVLDPIESFTPRQVAAGASYFSVMRANLTTLRSALSCT